MVFHFSASIEARFLKTRQILDVLAILVHMHNTGIEQDVIMVQCVVIIAQGGWPYLQIFLWTISITMTELGIKYPLVYQQV